MASLREQFEFKRLASETAPLIAGDFVLDTGKLSLLEAYVVEAESLWLLESPLAVQRRVNLVDRDSPHKSVELDMVLCLEGFADAVERFFWSIESFQRDIPENSIAAYDGLGDFGVAWTWEEGQEPNMVAFVRNNLVVTLYAHQSENMVPAAIELNANLPENTVNAYEDVEPFVLKQVRDVSGDVIKVEAGARLELGEPPADDSTLFFLASGGAVNRDADKPEARYYRAGLEKGRYQITVFRVGRGILPAIETLEIEIV